PVCHMVSRPPSLHLFLFILLARAPGSTLFPYTTLFRSALLRCERRNPTPVLLGRAGHEDGREPQKIGEHRQRDVDIDGVKLLRQDRKSTRLNSSHVKISYAVFCLKKKKQIYAVTWCIAC